LIPFLDKRQKLIDERQNSDEKKQSEHLILFNQSVGWELPLAQVSTCALCYPWHFVMQAFTTHKKKMSE